MKTWALVAVAAMGLTACQNDFEEQVEAKDSVVVTFVADSADTRTSVDTSGATPLFAWGDNETFAVLEQTDALAEATSVTFEKVDGLATITAEFAVNSGKESYSYVTVYPASGYVSAENIDNVTLALPAEQTMANGSYDPNADLMVSEVKTTNAQPTEAQMVGFHRIAAVVEMSINNLAIGAGEQIEKVEFIANGKDLAGTITANLTALDEDLEVKAGVSSVSVATTASDVVYFTVLPTTLAAGDAYSVAVVTNKYLYIKQGAIPEGKSLAFVSGKVTRFGVNMSGVNPSDKWVLVRDASTLKQGDVVTIAAKNYNYVIGKPHATNVYPLASQTEAIKVGNYLYHNPADDSADHMLQSYTLMQRDENRNAFDFYNGVDFVGDTNYGFAWANGSNNTPKLQDYCDINTLFDVTIADGVATITASEISGSYKYWRYYHSNTISSRKFDLTSSAITNDANKILLYKLEGAVGTIPTVAANVTVPDSDEPVVIAEEGAAEATAIDAVVFNYVGDWAISVSASETWLSVSYTDGVLSYTAEKNTSEKRTATVTITAKLEGQTDITWTFNVLQKGAPQEISIEEFVKLAKDENSKYKLTGKIVQLASNATSSGYYLADEKGNQAIINYLDTEDGDNVWGHESLTLNIGDVVTVTTVPMGSKKGGNSSNPSIYKGHYRLTASADKSLVGYEGDTANITVAVEQSGNISLPEDGVIQGAMAEAYDFVTFNYTDDATTATATFAENNGSSRNAVFNFTYGLASVPVSIGQQNHPSVKVGWFLVTDLSELVAGDKVIIAGKNPDETLDYAIKKYTSSSASSTSGIAITLQGNAISSVEGVEQFTLESGLADYPGTWAFKCDSYSRYIYPNSSSIKIKSALDKNGCWAIEIAADGKVTLTSQIGSSSSTKNTMMMNYTASNQTFGAYTAATTGKGAIYIYKYYN